MNIPKAIEILTYSSKQNTMLITGDEKDALRLGIEALTFVRLLRVAEGQLVIPLLPGETKE